MSDIYVITQEIIVQCIKYFAIRCVGKIICLAEKLKYALHQQWWIVIDLLIPLVVSNLPLLAFSRQYPANKLWDWIKFSVKGFV